MTTIYIKFRYPDDVYAIDLMYNMSLDESNQRPLVCARCGSTLYIPIDVPGDTIINLPRSNPFPIKHTPHAIYIEQETPSTIQVNRQLSFSEQQRLKQFPSMSYVGPDGYELLIDDYNDKPVNHDCRNQDLQHS